MSLILPLRLCLFAVALAGSAAIPVMARKGNQRERVLDLFQRAQQAEQQRDDLAAATLYREIVSLDPDIAEVWSNLGMALCQSQRYAEAIGAFERAIPLKPSLLAPHLFEDKAYLDMGEASKALTPLKAALALAPVQQETLLALADAYALTHQFASAVHTLQLAEKQEPDSEDVGSRLAVTYLEWATSIGATLRRSPSLYGRLLKSEGLIVEHPEEAEREYQNAIQALPESIEARLALAAFMMTHNPSAERLQQAREEIEIARRIAPKSSDVIAASIHASIALQDFASASTELHSLAGLDPDFAAANIDSLSMGFPEGKIAEITEQARSAKGSVSTSPFSYSAEFSSLERIRSVRPLHANEAAIFASACWHLHRYDVVVAELSRQSSLTEEGQYWLYRNCVEMGKESLEKTVEAHPDSVRSHLLLANLALQQEQLSRARTEYQAARSLRSDDAEIELLYVRFLETARDLDEAREEATRNADKFPTHSQLNSEAGDLVLKGGGNPLFAIHFLERSLSIDPKPIQPHIDLADAYAQMQRIDDAITVLNKVIGTDSDGSMHYRLARWYKETRHPAEAAAALEYCRRLKQSRIKDEQRGPPSLTNPSP